MTLTNEDFYISLKSSKGKAITCVQIKRTLLKGRQSTACRFQIFTLPHSQKINHSILTNFNHQHYKVTPHFKDYFHNTFPSGSTAQFIHINTSHSQTYYITHVILFRCIVSDAVFQHSKPFTLKVNAQNQVIPCHSIHQSCQYRCHYGNIRVIHSSSSNTKN